MLHTTFLWKKGICISDGSFDIYINPSLSHTTTVDTIDASSHKAIVFTRTNQKGKAVGDDTTSVVLLSPGESKQLEGFSLARCEHRDSQRLVISYDEIHVLYDIHLQDPAHLIGLVDISRLHAYFPDLSQQDMTFHISLLKDLGGAKYVVPFPTVDQLTAISFARSVMINQLGVPKFFKPGQHLVHI